MKTDKINKNNKESLKENEMNSDETEWNFATTDINEELFI